MNKQRNRKGVLSIEASISYSIFFMVMVTILYTMRIVYAYGLIQHAVSQTAKELSMYTYIYQVSGLNDLNQQISGATEERTEQFNADAESVVKFYEEFSAGDMTARYEGTISPTEILKNVGAAMLRKGNQEVNQQLFQLIVKPLLAGYIGADSQNTENAADTRLKNLRVVGGMSGLNLSSSRFFEDGATIDLVVCYTIDPVLPIDIMPELNLANRACVRGMNGIAVFSGSSGSENADDASIWDKPAMERGKLIQEQEGLRNLPDNFPVFCRYDSGSGKATAVQSIDIRDVSYQDMSAIKSVIGNKCRNIEAFQSKTYGGVTLEASDIKSRELIIYIPASSDGKTIDRSKYDQAVRELKSQYPDINIVTREIS
ncbi:MAG: hypothetical protein ACI39W_06700 [Brotaphodocola sp.]